MGNPSAGAWHTISFQAPLRVEAHPPKLCWSLITVH